MPDVALEKEFLVFVAATTKQYKRLADRAMVQFVVLRLCMVLASASVPALTRLDNRLWSTIAAVMVAAAAGLDTQFRWGEEWRHFRSVQLTLERLKRDYDFRKLSLKNAHPTEDVKTEANNLDKLHSEVEDLLQSESSAFFKFRITEWRSPRSHQR